MVKTLNEKTLKANVIKTIDLLVLKLQAWKRILELLQENKTRFEGKKVTKRLITFLEQDAFLSNYYFYLDLDCYKKVRSLNVWGNGIEFDKRVVLYFGFSIFNDDVKIFNLDKFVEENARFKHVQNDIDKLNKEFENIDDKVTEYNKTANKLDELRNNFHSLRFVDSRMYI